MISMQKIEKRLSRVRQAMVEKNLDALLVLIGENRRYLSGFTGEDTQFDETAGVLLVAPRRLVLATDSRYELQARQEAAGCEIVVYQKGIAQVLPEILTQLNACRVGFESVRLSFSDHERIQSALETADVKAALVPVESIVETLRMVKDEEEIDVMRRSLALAESAFERMLQTIKPGMTEKEIAWQMEKYMRESGAEGLSFPTIVASGPNSALPHAVPGDRKIGTGEPILFDWGAVLDGYCSDISRTVVIGEPDQRFRKVYEAVRAGQQKAIECAKPGMRAREVDAVARDHIDNAGFQNRFGHGLGHGVGMAVHEGPRISPLQETVLAPGMVFTVEPGIYLPDWGGVRIENMVAVGSDGLEVLNTLDTRMKIL